MKLFRVRVFAGSIVLSSLCLMASAQAKRKIIIDQDAAGPAGTDQQSMLLLIQSPQTEVLGITVVTGDQWLHEEVGHTLRMLELIGRPDIPVVQERSIRWSAGSRTPNNGSKSLVLCRGWEHGRQSTTILPTNSAKCRRVSPRRGLSRKMRRISCCAWFTSFSSKSRSTRAGR